jgi:hypothetical protein
VFSIRANSPGEALVRFAQRRPWGPEEEPTGEREVRLRIIA